MLQPSTDIRYTNISELRATIERYPYYHLARLCLLRQLYEDRNPEFHDELRKAALYLPSRETLFALFEEQKMRPVPREQASFYGATPGRKAVDRLEPTAAPKPVEEEQEDDRTGTLIESFLNTLPSTNEASPARPAVSRRRRRVDATVDYIAYMLEEEEEMAGGSAEETLLGVSQQGVEEGTATSTAMSIAMPVAEPSREEKKEEETSGSSEDMIESFIQSQGDRRIRLRERKDSDLQKPVLDVDNSSQKGVFTETLARIYIKQGKYEHAIEIIQRLSLKYPKKNRYFADQIRFLEKLLTNQRASKG